MKIIEGGIDWGDKKVNKKLTFTNSKDGGYISLDDLTELLDNREEGPDNEKFFDDLTEMVNKGLNLNRKKGESDEV